MRRVPLPWAIISWFILLVLLIIKGLSGNGIALIILIINGILIVFKLFQLWDDDSEYVARNRYLGKKPEGEYIPKEKSEKRQREDLYNQLARANNFQSVLEVEMLAKKNNPDAIYVMGLFASKTAKTEEEQKEATILIQKAADLGQANALKMIAVKSQ